MVQIARFAHRKVTVFSTFRRQNSDWLVMFEFGGGPLSSSDVVRSSVNIFSGIFQCIQAFLDENRSATLIFSNEDGDIRRLYERWRR